MTDFPKQSNPVMKSKTLHLDLTMITLYTSTFTGRFDLANGLAAGHLCQRAIPFLEVSYCIRSSVKTNSWKDTTEERAAAGAVVVVGVEVVVVTIILHHF